jgi:hypothetical protein
MGGPVGTGSRCGTRTGYDYHRLAGEEACADCRAAVARAARAWPSKKNRARGCAVCGRVHRGNHCKPEDARSVTVSVSLPGWLHRSMTERVPWGERSAWVAGLVAAELERDMHPCTKNHIVECCDLVGGCRTVAG